jgi:hypothetical protein
MIASAPLYLTLRPLPSEGHSDHGGQHIRAGRLATRKLA